MRKLRALSAGQFLRLMFGFFTLFALASAFLAPDRGQMLQGFVQVITSPVKVPTNCFALGGISGTMLNMALVCAVMTGLFCLPGAEPNAGSTLAFFLTAGFCTWGVTALNIWPTFLGVALYCLVKREKLGGQVNAMLFSTGIAPLITDLMIRYPGEAVGGFHPAGILGAVLIGVIIGFFLPAGISHSPAMHKGFDLYSAALPIGLTAFFLRAALYKVMGVPVPAGSDPAGLKIDSWAFAHAFAVTFFLLCIVVALAMGCRGKDYAALLREPGKGVDISKKYGVPVFLMNMGVYGLFILAYYNLIGATFNGLTFGLLFCMVCCANSGAHPGNVWPIMAGYVGMSLLAAGVSGTLEGAKFTQVINQQAVVIGLCFASGLCPITGTYGWFWGMLTGGLHYLLVTSVPDLHGGFCLYNGGFTAALICMIFVPQLERFVKTRQERKAAPAK